MVMFYSKMPPFFGDMKRWYTIYTLRRLIRRTFKQYFKIAKELRRLGMKSTSKIHWNESQMHFFSANIVAQTLHKLESITALVDKGLSADAWPIVRSLIESVLDHDYILRNPEKLDLYFKYSIYLDIQLVKRVESSRLLTDEEQVEYAKMKAEWEKYKNLFKELRDIRRAWRDKSLEEIEKEIKLESMYSLVYKEANDYVHSNSNLIRTFIVGKNEQGLLLKGGGVFDKRDITLITAATLVLVLFVFLRANKYFSLGLGDEIKRLDRMITCYHDNDLAKGAS